MVKTDASCLVFNYMGPRPAATLKIYQQYFRSTRQLIYQLTDFHDGAPPFARKVSLNPGHYKIQFEISSSEVNYYRHTFKAVGNIQISNMNCEEVGM